MGMFDDYIPEPPLTCRACSALLDGFQGKDGPCAMLVWGQGAATPVDQRVDEDCKLAPEKIHAFRLPSRFEIRTQCTSRSDSRGARIAER